MKVLIDMNLSPLWAEFFRSESVEATHWSHIGAHSARDDELMQWARDNDHIVFTHDLDFSALLAMTRHKGPSVIQVRTRDPLPDSLGRDVLRVLHMRAAEIAQGAIVTIDRAKSRVRLLPIE